MEEEEKIALVGIRRRSYDKQPSSRTHCTPIRWLMVISAAITAVIFAFALGLSIGLGAGESLPPGSGSYQQAAVATDAGPCSQVGVETLKRGGSAVDAAISATLCVGVVNLHSTGIGGGGFMVYYNASSGEAFALDFREKAPMNASTFMYNDTAPDASTSG